MRCKLHYFEEVEDSKEVDEEGKPIKQKVDKGICNGPVKPEIVFFGEPLPKKFHWGWDRIRNKPMFPPPTLDGVVPPLFEDGGCDLMIVIGTALAVFPFSATVSMAEENCPRVLINLENTIASGFDFEDLYKYPSYLFLKGRCDEVIHQLVNDVGWSEEFN